MLRRTPLRRKTPLRAKSNSPLAVAHQKLWEAFSLMIRQRDYWTCFTCGTKVKPWEKDERGVSMAFYMHAGHYKPQGTFKSVKYDPQNVHAQDARCNKWLHGNLAAYSLKLEIKYGFGILQELERRSRLYFDYTIPKLEALTQAAKTGIEEYSKVYESMRPREDKERSNFAKAA